MKTTVSTVQKMKDNGEKITMLTAYDYSTAKLFDEAGIDTMLVGDSLGMVMLGYDSTIPVTVDDMIHHGAAVVRGAKNAMIVVDMPFLSYHTSVYDAVANAGRIMKALDQETKETYSALTKEIIKLAQMRHPDISYADMKHVLEEEK